MPPSIVHRLLIYDRPPAATCVYERVLPPPPPLPPAVGVPPSADAAAAAAAAAAVPADTLRDVVHVFSQFSRDVGGGEVQRLVFRRPPPPLGDGSVQWAPEPDEPLLSSAWPSLSLTTTTADAFLVIALDNAAVPPTPAPAYGGPPAAADPPDAVSAFVAAVAAEGSLSGK
ncbi:hypothetical protein I4F81_000832 [Pyropia yezoensis]|uniref:Uncharacterized protein n=1 Tax=Pyropia yezoensis TaxID=2788 RepID=A0ACC3BKE9_PYRYE|nr:hypothetical protein I4F81_000832 [Neopyropia yezoensis]